VLAYLFPDKADLFGRMAQEAARLKLEAGVSFPSDIEAGLALGHQVGARVKCRVNRHTDHLVACRGLIRLTVPADPTDGPTEPRSISFVARTIRRGGSTLPVIRLIRICALCTPRS
jgi:hypothetical protein